MNEIVIVVLSGAIACILTGVVRRYALARGVLDVPNERSSHSIATPRGGGVAIVLVFLLLLPFSGLQYTDIIAIAGAGGGVALLGFVDDHRHVPVYWRLAGHCLAAIWALYWLDGMPDLLLWESGILSSLVSCVFFVFYLVWLLNLYNFMDGIDGIASIEAITVSLGALILYAVSGLAVGGMFAHYLLVAAVLGFLVWNFPKARIFMGDAGSGFLGIVLGIFSVMAALHDIALFWAWVILLGMFITDATVTLMRRFVRGARVYEAHREHGYQVAAIRYASHVPVTISFGLINLVWLLPIAALVAAGSMPALWGVSLAYAPLLLLAHHFRAGCGDRL